MTFLVIFFVAIFSSLLKLCALLTYAQCKSNICLLGKTALVTGGNSGIGYEIVLNLVSRGCRVIIADKVRDPDLKKKIFEETNSTNIAYQYVDLASFKSVRELARKLINSEEKLDILINNAGICAPATTTEDGLDLTMQVNYFSAFLLTHLLVDLLKKSSGRIIFTSSFASFLNNLTVNNLKHSGDFYGYCNSKLCDIIAADIFSRKLKKHNVTSNSYHPGLVSTNIFQAGRKEIPSFSSLSMWTFFLEYGSFVVGKTPQEGAQTAVYLACANEVEGVTGKFFAETKFAIRPLKTYDKAFCNAIWKATEEAVKLEPHEKI